MRNSSLSQATACALALFFLCATAGLAVAGSTDEAGENAAITAKVEARLKAHSEVGAFDIQVETDDGVVTLRGEVDSKKVRDKALKLASETRGVREVRSIIQIVPDEN